MSPETARLLLGLPATARPEDAERSFRRLAHELHPDLGGDDEAFCRLLQARAVLREQEPGKGRRRTPLIVVHRGPWWRRLLRTLLDYAERRRNPAPRRVE